ncbi:MFS transporter [Streptomyces kaempferi]
MTSVHLFLAHGVLALGMGLVPALVTTFRSDYALSSGQIANIQNLKDAGLITAMFAGPAVLRRIGVAATTLLALLVGLSGCAVLVIAQSLPGVMAGAFLHGAAFSFGCLATVSHLFRLPKRYHRISALYATFGVANFVAPFTVGLLVPDDGDYRAIYAIFAAALVVLVVMGTVLNGSVDTTAVVSTDRSGQPRLTLDRLRTWLPDITVYATLMAAETVVVCWVTTLGQYHYGLSLSEASVLLALLWVAHTSARLAGDLLTGHMSVPAVVLCGALLAVIGDVLLCALGDPGLRGRTGLRRRGGPSCPPAPGLDAEQDSCPAARPAQRLTRRQLGDRDHGHGLADRHHGRHRHQSPVPRVGRLLHRPRPLGRAPRNPQDENVLIVPVVAGPDLSGSLRTT